MKNDFIIFSLPEKNFFYLLYNNNNGNQKIEFSSFDAQKKIIFQNHTKKKIFLENLSLNNLNFSPKKSSKELNFKEYLNIFQQCIDKINTNFFKKIVISRVKKINYLQINLIKTLKKLRIEFPKALIYFFIKNKSVWLGATPELLGKLSGNLFKTISLAGTICKNQSSFNQKEIDEQKIVTNFIEFILKKYSKSIKISKTSDYHYSNLTHLVTKFSGLINPLQYENLIKELHPTPAVCGLPQDKTFKFIQKIEPHNRELYCGKIQINLYNSKITFVNLRCLKLFKNYFKVFVGSGITSDSNAENEWNETEIKAKSIIKNLVYS